MDNFASLFWVVSLIVSLEFPFHGVWMISGDLTRDGTYLATRVFVENNSVYEEFHLFAK